ncbi:MAG: hypothetical protein A2840_01015 [Candidatus Buchananbacteria bacterium RIFCSPHIGHO2_01_FULL_47_11b]|uniref:Aminotransferase DegT n=1 Tax=Candidatus Buchananbacteria bacterium RIFCSPHIGHO2_01_FULL_47_11b TaxID=1797537 RepID=A0A1G1Y5X2_9BACT|nr:MAG: hypothetical protein A2840_01015 [Candidatus Buchananbacteria bacterium RIFCSPHIGHO2_01_FULL_47_11b]
MSRINKENLGVGTLEISAQARRYIKKVLDTRRLSYGPFIQRFERELSKAHGLKFGVMVNSGTSALRMAVACLKELHGWHDGDEIIVPAVTFVATANVVVDHNLKPVFVDVDPVTYNIDPAKIEKRITKKTKAIMVVHLFGQPAEMDPILKIARKYKLKIIEDSAETMFVKYKGTPVGSFGDIACFSTYVAHLIVTGVGGVVATNNRRYAEVLRSLANHGRDNIYISIDDDKGKKGKQLQQIIARRFSFVRPGYSFRVTELEGALGCAQLEIAADILKQRRRNGEYLIKGLSQLGDRIQLPSWPKYKGHAFMMFPIVIRNGGGVSKAKLTQYLEERGIETRDMLPLINQPYYRKTFKIKQSDYPIADWINRYGFYIGCHQQMRKTELDYIIKTFVRYFEK